MTVINSISFTNVHGRFKQVEFLAANRSKLESFETTIITGKNGSHKSSLLKQVVATLGPESKELIGGKPAQVALSGSLLLCVSGSAADRFPQKELSGGYRTEFDVPNYTYVGQRVMSNLLSKKAPLEAILGFALAPKKIERFSWNFFLQAHTYAGIAPFVVYEITAANSKQTELDLMVALHSLTPKSDKERKTRDGLYVIPLYISLLHGPASSRKSLTFNELSEGLVNFGEIAFTL